MAAAARRLATNAPGDFFVDATCIDCETCNWLAPASFDEARVPGHGILSRVYRQPRDAGERLRAEMALLACPVGAIGTTAKHDLGAARAAFPERIDGEVYHCGYHAAASFGAASYLVRRDDGNILVDSPRYTAPLADRIAALGGVRTLFLTHSDDVADHARWRERFGCERILHRRDASRTTRGVERLIEGEAAIELAPGAVILPVPGHTAGSCCLLVDGKHLFSGDHAAWSPERGHVVAFREVCWHDWGDLTRSMQRLAELEFSWILPGHGWRCHFPPDRMRREMQRCLDWMDRQ
jgi:glyoxylase-like metal-dependent hydrolase (beta-lactamase superfamily II)/ferredoxin